MTESGFVDLRSFRKLRAEVGLCTKCAFKIIGLTFYLTFCAGTPDYQVYCSTSALLAIGLEWVEGPSLGFLSFSGCLSGAAFAFGYMFPSFPSQNHFPFGKLGCYLGSQRRQLRRLVAVLTTCESELQRLRWQQPFVWLTWKRVRSCLEGAVW